jgi:RNA polymerase sigma-70 factor (ECF subfamily)
MATARHRFVTTRWSLVLAAREGSPDAGDALATLCRQYWDPLYAFLRRQGFSADDAQDLTQGFFARLLEKHYLDGAQPERGRFRSFLLASLKHFSLNQLERERATKRGGGVTTLPLTFDDAESRYVREPSDNETPERLFERQWALATLERAVTLVRDEHRQAGTSGLFDRLLPCVTREPQYPPYAALAEATGMSEVALRVATHRLRRRIAAALRAEIASTLSNPEDVGDELRYLARVLQA